MVRNLRKNPLLNGLLIFPLLVSVGCFPPPPDPDGKDKDSDTDAEDSESGEEDTESGDDSGKDTDSPGSESSGDESETGDDESETGDDESETGDDSETGDEPGEDKTTGDDSGEDSSTTGDDTTGGTPDDPEPGETPDDPEPEPAPPGVSGRVVDADGDPVGDVVIAVCAETCLEPIKSKDDGTFHNPDVPEEWEHYHVTVGSKEGVEFFAGSIVEVHAEHSRGDDEGIAVGDMTFLRISGKGAASFEGLEGPQTFETGDFSFSVEMDAFDYGIYATTEAFTYIEVPKDRYREEEKSIEGNEVACAFGMYPFGGHLYDDDAPTGALTIANDCGLDDGQEVVVYQQHYNDGNLLELGSTKVKDSKISFDSGLKYFARIYVAKK